MYFKKDSMKRIKNLSLGLFSLFLLSSFAFLNSNNIEIQDFMDKVNAGTEFKLIHNQVYSLKSQKDENGKYMKEKVWKDLGEGFGGEINKSEKQLHTNTFEIFTVEKVTEFPRNSVPLFDLSLEPEHASILEATDIVKITGDKKEDSKNRRVMYCFKKGDKLLYVMHQYWGYYMDNPRTMLFGEIES